MERVYGGCLCYGPPIENGFYYDMFLENEWASAVSALIRLVLLGWDTKNIDGDWFWNKIILKGLLLDVKWMIGALQMPITPQNYSLIDGCVSC